MDLSCSCGARFRTAAAEAMHRHNFPALCRKPKQRPGTPKGPRGTFTPRKSRAKPKADHVAEARKMVPA